LIAVIEAKQALFYASLELKAQQFPAARQQRASPTVVRD